MIVSSDPVGLRLVGSEMLAGSDLEHGPARGPALAALLYRLNAARILVAGPHAVDLIALLAERHPQVGCLVRSYPDGLVLAELFQGRIEVLCGSLAKLSVTEPYDAVVAFDGVERLCSTEGAQLTWPESLRALVAAVRPGGTLLLGITNTFGASRLVSTVDSGHGSPWLAAEGASYGRPAAPARLRDELRDAGVRIERLWAGFAEPTAPEVLVRSEALDAEPARGGQLDAPLGAAFARAFAGAPLLMDPRRLVADAVRSGLGLEIAPVWIVNAMQRQAEPIGEPPRATPQPRAELDQGGPEIVIADGLGPLALTYEITDSTGEWCRRTVRGSARAGPLEVGAVRRDGAALAGPVPAGTSLAALLLDACATHNIPRLRRLLTQWCVLAGTNALATADEVILTPDGMVTWDPSWSTVVPVRPEVAIARCVRRLAVTMVEGGHPHPWPAVAEADALAIVLGGLAGHVLDAPLLADAVALEVAVRTGQLGLDEAARERLARRLARVAVGTPPAELRGLRELHAIVAGLRRDLDHAQGKLGWYERRLSSTEVALRDARLEARQRRRPARVLAPVRRFGRAILRRLGLLTAARQFKKRLRWRV